nr:unnamed protein product [Spirometra erinaceieuropaei]
MSSLHILLVSTQPAVPVPYNLFCQGPSLHLRLLRRLPPEQTGETGQPEAVDTSLIVTFGTCSLSLDIGLRRLFPLAFVIADALCAFLAQTSFQLPIFRSASDGLLYTAKPPVSPSGASLPPSDHVPLNNAIIPNCYPIPHPQDFAGTLSTKSVFSNIDLVRAFHEITAVSEDVLTTAVTIPLATPSSYAHIDDLSIASSTSEEKVEHLSVFGVPFLEFLEHLVNSICIYSFPSRVAAIREFLPPPLPSVNCSAFLGMMDFCRRSVPSCADIILQLMNLLLCPTCSLKLSADDLSAFGKAKAALVGATLPTHNAFEAPISLMVYPFNAATGPVLQQHLAGQTQPLLFFLQKVIT